MNRRRFGALTTGALLFTPFVAKAQSEAITVHVSGGFYGDGNIKAFTEPFEKATGIHVNAVKSEVPAAQFELAARSGSLDIDSFLTTEADGTRFAREGYLADIDYSGFDRKDLAGLSAVARKIWGTESIEAGFVLSINAKAHPAGAPRPGSWRDFWDYEKFPGVRTLQSGQAGTQGPWEEALLADGVAMGDLYPLDIDRVFRSLDRVKAQIRKWWVQGNDVQQLFNSGVVDIGMNFDGRALALQAAGKPVDIEYNEAKVYGVYWVIPKASKRQAATQKFIAFASRAEQQAALANITKYAPSNSTAYNFIEPDIARKLISYPENSKNSFRLNGAWFAETGPDGKANSARLVERWNEWIVQ
ncbi:MAG: extracellular solute-binding protein [Alphaproteobacteria bacterium]|nr:extracellular solute-binding protein [Alphaproteobacteria bacterium]